MKNYYAILGVPRNATAAGIRAAYRDAVRRTHPDHAGAHAAADFRDVIEAHSVLADPDRRVQYNETLKREEQERDSRQLLHKRPHEFPNSEALQGLSIEVILTPEEAALSGVVSVGVPVYEACGGCAGSGWDWLFPCGQCGGMGRIFRLQPVDIPIPRTLRLGLTPEVAIETRGMSNLPLEIRLRVLGR